MKQCNLEEVRGKLDKLLKVYETKKQLSIALNTHPSQITRWLNYKSYNLGTIARIERLYKEVFTNLGSSGGNPDRGF